MTESIIRRLFFLSALVVSILFSDNLFARKTDSNWLTTTVSSETGSHKHQDQLINSDFSPFALFNRGEHSVKNFSERGSETKTKWTSSRFNAVSYASCITVTYSVILLKRNCLQNSPLYLINRSLLI